MGSLAAVAQQGPEQPPAQTAPASPPEPDTAPQTTPPPKAVKPSETPAGAAPGQDLVGLDVFSSDGTRVGEVRSVNTGPDGNVVGLHVKTGGFLGFGGRLVAIPSGKFTRKGSSIRLSMAAEQVEALPEIKE